MNLPEALDAALTARYMTGEVKRPVTHRQGLMARLNQLQKLYPSKQAMAKAVGIPERTLRDWRSGKTKPSAANARKLEGAHHRLIALPRLRKRINGKPIPNSVTVTADVDWNGYKNRQSHRTVTLGAMRPVMARTIRAWATAGPQAAARVFQQGAATINNLPNSADRPGIQFEGDDVRLTFPWE